jgi:hypothetical protein
MGRWGEPQAMAPRERSIVVRMKQPAKTFQTTRENAGKENSLYPPWLEKLWHLYEGDLIRVAGDLDAGALQPGDEAYVLLHVSALKPRKASFLNDLNDFQASHNLPVVVEYSAAGLDLGFWCRHDRHPCLSRWLTGCW